MLRRILLASAGATALAATALAADLPSRAPPPVYLPPPPLFTWTGIYVGLDGGGGVIKFRRSGLYDTNPVNDSFNHDGFFAGGQIGFNWQVAPQWVLGAEADFQGANFNRAISPCAAGIDAGIGADGDCFDDRSAASINLNWFGTARGRVGFLVTPAILVYGTGGFAYGQVNYSVFDFTFGGGGPGVGFGSQRKVETGWTAGGGVEYAINNNWSVKVEYLHMELGKQFGNSTFTPVPGLNAPTFVARIGATADLARFGVNYKFNWWGPGPVVAKY